MHDGFVAYDKYQEWRPWIFLFSLSAFAASGYFWTTRGLMKRKRGHRVTEANIMFPLAMATSGTIAWVTRPDYLFPPATPRMTAEGTPDQPGFLSWIDSRVEQLNAKDPFFANKAFTRLINTPGIAETWEETPEIARTFITCGRRG